MARQFAQPVLVFGLVFVVLGCTSISSTPAPSVAPTSAASALPSLATEQSPVVSGLVPTALASLGLESPPLTPPTLEATPSVTAPPTPKPTKEAAPNLVVTKFAIDADVVLVETPFNALFTVKNTGTGGAGPFTVGVQPTNTDDGVEGPYHPATVEGLAVGDTYKASVSVQFPKAGHWKLSTIADIKDEIDESNETDNSKDLAILARDGLPDLQWANGAGFSFTASQTKPGYYDVAYDFINKGTADNAGETAFIGVTWYRDEDSASGTFSDVPIGDLAVGEERVLEQSLQMPGTGTYKIYAFLDKDHVVDELNEDNNESQITVSVP